MQRRLLYFVPTVATIVAAYALLGPGRGHPVVGCRVLVADDADGRLRSLRLEVIERLGGYEEPRAAEGLRVMLDGTRVFEGAVEANGMLDLRVEAGSAGPRKLVVERGGAVLASGMLESKEAQLPPVGS